MQQVPGIACRDKCQAWPGSLRSSFYVPQLDGLRFCAFLSVFVGHAAQTPVLLAGGFGVVLFFALSSYLITSLLVREADTYGRIDVPAFWLRRVLRIWPLYLGFVFVDAAWTNLPMSTVLAFSLFAGNWSLARGHGIGLGDVLWSVSVEEQFYLVWPFVLAALPRRFLRPACVSLVAVALATRFGLYLHGSSIGPVWLNTFSHLDAIGVGALVALGPRVQLAPLARGVVGAACALGVAAGAVTIWYVLLGPPAPLYVRAGYEAITSLVFLSVALACGGLLLATLAGSAWLARPVPVYLGRVSYGLYVFHTSAITLVDGWSWPWRLPAAFALTLAAAAVSYRYFEQPFLRLKARFTCVPSGGQA